MSRIGDRIDNKKGVGYKMLLYVGRSEHFSRLRKSED
jgi:hypothetical protein